MMTTDDVKSMFTPRLKKGGDRKVWSIDLHTVWIPVFTAANTRGDQDIAPDVLGAPLRLAKSEDGTILFTKAGLPRMKVHPVLAEKVKVARDNIVAGMLEYVGDTAREMPDAYKAQVELAQAAGRPINAQADQDVEDYLVKLAAERAAQESPTPSENGETPKRRKVAATA